MNNPTKYFLSFVGGALLVLGSTVLAQVVPTMTHESSFSDVQRGTFFEGSVEKLVRQGIVKGYNDGTFGPDDFVTRAQVSVIVDRYDQEVIQKLREQIENMRLQSNLGQCGDGIVQIGETCDDGNNADGDDCSAICLKEKTIQPVSSGQTPPSIVVPEDNTCFYNGKKYATGESFQAMDGCNTCGCKHGGEVLCSMYACTPDACAEEGERVYYESAFGATECCNKSAGIRPVSFLNENGLCMAPTNGQKGTCSEGWFKHCGDGTCGSEEDICTCPKDCNK